MSFWKKKISSDEYLELKQALESLKIEFNSLRLDLELIIKKLKFKYKINTREKEEEEKDIKGKMLLPDDGVV